MLLEAAQYRSPSLEVLLVTDKADALQKVVQRLLLPLNVSYYQAQKPVEDNNQYWLAWEHRTAIKQAAARRNYSTVVYMEVRGCFFQPPTDCCIFVRCSDHATLDDQPSTHFHSQCDTQLM